MRIFVCLPALALAIAVFALASRPAQAGAEQTYKDVCMACHAAGVDKAPMLGDRKAWAPLIKEGQARLTADGWVGVRKMPAKGGKADLSIEEFAQAVAFMARAAGANWKDPDAELLARIRAEESKILARRKAQKPGP